MFPCLTCDRVVQLCMRATMINPSHTFGMHTEASISMSGMFVLVDIHREMPAYVNSTIHTASKTPQNNVISELSISFLPAIYKDQRSAHLRYGQ